MAVDTKDKRISAMLVASPTGRVLPDPDGSIDAGDRGHQSLMYSGLVASVTISMDMWYAETQRPTLPPMDVVSY